MAQAGLLRASCDFLGLKWSSNNVDENKKLYLIVKKMSKMSGMSRKKIFSERHIEETYCTKTKVFFNLVETLYNLQTKCKRVQQYFSLNFLKILSFCIPSS